MTCRHGPNDKSCSSYRTPAQRIAELQKEISKQKAEVGEPDNSQFEIIDVLELTTGLILKVKYEDCPNCSYEGIKVLVYLRATIRDALKWKVIDPHFSDKLPHGPKHAPSPDARFPASEDGWKNAKLFLSYAESKT